MSIGNFYAYLFRWPGQWQIDIHIPRVRGWFCLGWCRRERRPHLTAYWSPDATPIRRDGARGWMHARCA